MQTHGLHHQHLLPRTKERRTLHAPVALSSATSTTLPRKNRSDLNAIAGNAENVKVTTRWWGGTTHHRLLRNHQPQTKRVREEANEKDVKQKIEEPRHSARGAPRPERPNIPRTRERLEAITRKGEGGAKEEPNTSRNASQDQVG